MKKILPGLFALIICYTASAQKVVVDANAELRELSGSFHSIIVSDAIDLYLSQADVEAVAVSSSDGNAISDIITKVEDSVLYILHDGNWASRKGRKLKAYVSFKHLQHLEAKGASNVVFTDVVRSNALVVKLSGASDLRGSIQADTLHLGLSGASNLRLSGTVAVITIDSEGASDVKAFDLVAGACTAKASGASDINITVTKELTAVASGASNIFYKGDALAMDIKSRGASKIGKRG